MQHGSVRQQQGIGERIELGSQLRIGMLALCVHAPGEVVVSAFAGAHDIAIPNANTVPFSLLIQGHPVVAGAF